VTGGVGKANEKGGGQLEESTGKFQVVVVGKQKKKGPTSGGRKASPRNNTGLQGENYYYLKKTGGKGARVVLSTRTKGGDEPHT